jgi:hypothetical protein
VPGAAILGVLGIVFDERKWLAIVCTAIAGAACLLFFLSIIAALLCL